MSVIGNKGKFSERIKKIATSKKKKKKKNDIEDSEELYKNFLKVVPAVPLLVYDNVVNVNSEKENSAFDKINCYDQGKKIGKQILNNVVETNDSARGFNEKISTKNVNDLKKKKYTTLINQIDVSLIKKRQDEYYNNGNIDDDKEKKETKNDNIEQARELEKKIINRIKKYLIKTVNELEILQSELYLVSEVKGDSNE